MISGGNFDVDVTLRDPFKSIVKSRDREQYDYFEHIAKAEGEYEVYFIIDGVFLFSNFFSFALVTSSPR